MSFASKVVSVCCRCKTSVPPGVTEASQVAL
jgi:hypothetical protein